MHKNKLSVLISNLNNIKRISISKPNKIFSLAPSNSLNQLFFSTKLTHVLSTSCPNRNLLISKSFEQTYFILQNNYSTKQDKPNNDNEDQKFTSETHNLTDQTKDQNSDDKIKNKLNSTDLLKDKDKQIAELKDLYLRQLAEQENLLKRTKKQIEDVKSYSLQRFVQDLLSTLDVLDIAIKSVPLTENNNNKQLKDLHEGVTLTYKGLLQTFKKYGIEKIDPIDQEFDPNVHEAIYQAKIQDKRPGTVIRVEKVGYMLNGRVVRPAQVGVAKE